MNSEIQKLNKRAEEYSKILENIEKEISKVIVGQEGIIRKFLIGLITNDLIIKFLKSEKKDIKEIKECFDLSSLVEFARYQANKKDFEKIIKIVEKKINKT